MKLTYKDKWCVDHYYVDGNEIKDLTSVRIKTINYDVYMPEIHLFLIMTWDTLIQRILGIIL